MINDFFKQTQFLLSVASLAQLPADLGTEIAFAGRSNAGKSSAINAITGIKNLARTSKTPGRTQQINFFTINKKSRLVDLPGYGYASVPLQVKKQWQQLLNDYLSSRKSLCGLVLVSDIRTALTDFDREMLDWTFESRLPVYLLLTKVDKLTQSEAHKQLKAVLADLGNIITPNQVLLFSAKKGHGLQKARAYIAQMLAHNPPGDVD